MNFLQETELTTVPIGDATYGLHAQHTIARIILERCMPVGSELTGAAIEEVIEGLAPWQPVTRAGRFAKRITKYVKETWAGSLPTTTLSTIGNYLAGDLPSDNITYAITKQFDWEQGDFGDKGSCFWTAGNHEMPRLTLSDAYALRFYGSNGGGIARAILLPVPEGALAINCYGHNIFQVLRRIQIIAPDLPATIVPVDPANRDLYTNLNQGILIGTPYYGHGEPLTFVFHLPPLPPSPRLRRADNYVPLNACRECYLRDGFHNESDYHIQTLNGRIHLCGDCVERLLDTGELVYVELTESYHYVSEVVTVPLVVPHRQRGRNSNDNALNIYWQRGRFPVWINYTLPREVCGVCAHNSHHLRFASINHTRVEYICPACALDYLLDSYCHACGALLAQGDVCSCQPLPEGDVHERPARTIAEGVITLTDDEARPILEHFAPSVRHRGDEAGDAGGVGDVHADGDSPPEEGGDDEDEEEDLAIRW